MMVRRPGPGVMPLPALPWGVAVLRTVRRRPVLILTALVLAGFCVVALLGDALTAQSAAEQVLADRLQGLSWAHPFGTDHLGRDLLARTLEGAQTSVAVGLAVMAVGTAFAVTLAIVSGFVGGWVDLLLQRLVDAVMAIPPLILGVTLITIIGTGLTEIVLVISVAVAFSSTRTIRSAVIAVRAQPYVDAATALGAPGWWIVVRHVLPNVLSPILVVASLNVGYAILVEASLSFLGFGVPPPTPTWGGLIAGEARVYMFSAPWLAIFPGLALTIVVLSVNLFGDALRDALDPRLRRTA